MSDRPYTDDDIRAEAARLLAIASANADDAIRPAVQRKWGGKADSEAIDEACDQIVTLLDGAADVSEWAVSLGADGLEPDGHTLQLGVDPGDGDRPRIRLHFAFHPDMADADRDHFVMALSKVVLRNL
ncbi:hypothetical protein GCM10010294_25330 [Streptomyces griseoloalbus]|uniref:hypothetical protein n=1 Tax=Streptomyces griseoloalbus TaxID=67303 RepID=UPI001875247F|nr:hypothetical protein GCM10010294_25330 [Streptomyces griseoloalbus]